MDGLTLVGTTDVAYSGDPAHAKVGSEEVDYLCRVVADSLCRPIRQEDIQWRYVGVRPLYDDGQVDASTVTRDYVFDLDAPAGQAPLLSVFGGKLTTYRRLAEHALDELLPQLGRSHNAWTRAATLPGGDIAGLDMDAFVAEQTARYAFAAPPLIRRLCRAYGTRIERIIGTARLESDLGAELAPQLYEAELEYLRTHEWARCADDVLWRRSKLGLTLAPQAHERIERWLTAAGAIPFDPLDMSSRTRR